MARHLLGVVDCRSAMALTVAVGTLKRPGCGMNFLMGSGWMNVYRMFHNYSNDGVTCILGGSAEMDMMRVAKSFDG